jgi:hypothetical protein
LDESTNSEYGVSDVTNPTKITPKIMHKSRSTKKVVERPIEIEKVQKATEPEILQLEKPAEKKFIMVRPI